jgi:hypothetical protein
MIGLKCALHISTVALTDQTGYIWGKLGGIADNGSANIVFAENIAWDLTHKKPSLWIACITIYCL